MRLLFHPFRIFLSRKYIRSLANLTIIFIILSIVFYLKEYLSSNDLRSFVLSTNERVYSNDEVKDLDSIEHIKNIIRSTPIENLYSDTFNDYLNEDSFITNIGILTCYNFIFKLFCTGDRDSIFDSPPQSLSVSKIIQQKVVPSKFKSSLFGTTKQIFFDFININDIPNNNLHNNIENINHAIPPDTNIFLHNKNNKNNLKINDYTWHNNNFYTTSLNELLLSSIPIEHSNEIRSYLKSLHLLSDIDLFFGNNSQDPRYNWYLQKNSIFHSDNKFNSYLSFKYTSISATPQQNEIQLIKNPLTNHFKIMQIADLHFGIDTINSKKDDPDAKSLDFIGKVLDQELPDLVVLSGDQIMGDLSKKDSKSSLLKALYPIIKRKIPYTMVWGNHDDEGSFDRWQLSEFVSKLPYSLYKMNAMDTHDQSFGVGNYVIYVYDNNIPVIDFYTPPMISLMFLDSHKYTRSKIRPGYDFIKKQQLNYLKYEKSILTGVTDYHTSLAFFHIPLREYLNIKSHRKETKGEQNPFIGSVGEPVCCSHHESDAIKTFAELGVDVVSVGHDHCNDYCLEDDSTDRDIWLCYAGVAGEGGYGCKGGFDRRVRIYDVEPDSGRIASWKILQSDLHGRLDYQIITDKKGNEGLKVPEIPDTLFAPKSGAT